MPEEATGQKQAGVLPRTVVVEPGRSFPAREESPRRRLVERQLRSTDEVAWPESSDPKEPLGSPDVARLPAVRGADQRDVARGQAKPLDPPGLDQRQCLEGFGRGPEKDPQGRIAADRDEPPILVGDGGVPPVLGLDG